MRTIAASASAFSVLSGCATYDVTVSDEAGKPHVVDVHLGAGGFFTGPLPGSWEDPDSGRSLALRAAQQTCQSNRTATPEELHLTRGPALYNYRRYSFTCPEIGEISK